MTREDAERQTTADEDTVMNQPAYEAKPLASPGSYGRPNERADDRAAVPPSTPTPQASTGDAAERPEPIWPAAGAAADGGGLGRPLPRAGGGPVVPPLSPSLSGEPPPLSAIGEASMGQNDPAARPQPVGFLLHAPQQATGRIEEAAAKAQLPLRTVDGLEQVVEASALQPTALLISVPQVDESILDLLRTTASRSRGGAPALVISGRQNVDEAVDCLQNDAFGFVAAPIDPERLVAQIGHLVAESVARHEQASRLMQLRKRYDSLTQKERDVLDLVHAGMSNRQIANSLSISVRAVEDRRSRAMKRMHASSLVELVRLLQQIEPRV